MNVILVSIIQEINADSVPPSLSCRSIYDYVEQAESFASDIISNRSNHSETLMKSVSKGLQTGNFSHRFLDYYNAA